MDGYGTCHRHRENSQKNYLDLNDIHCIELNEAFAAQALAVIEQAQLPEQIINPHGSAIALGHPLGATGTIRLATMQSIMSNQTGYGIITMCVGSGMGAAGLFKFIE